MPELLDPQVAVAVAADSADCVRSTMAAVRLSIFWFGVRRTLTQDQKSQAADTFGAEGDYLSAAKKLLDTSHPAFRAVTSIRTRAIGLWKGMTLPYPEPGIRLIRQDDITSFSSQIRHLQSQLKSAAAELSDCYQELKAAARQRLGKLFASTDYPESLADYFAVCCDFPSVEPPEYLKLLSPDLYEQEAQRVRARFQEAVQLAEQAFVDEFAKTVSHLTERLSGQEDGKPKVFRDSAVENLHEFFERFRHLSVHSSHQLEELVDQAQRITRGVAPQALREDTDLRQKMATQLSCVQSVLDGLLVDRPRRNILRRLRS